MRYWIRFISLMFCLLALQFDPSFAGSSIRSLKNEPFLRDQVSFWLRVYTELSQNEGFIHDAKYPKVIYEKVEFGGGGSSRRAKVVNQAEKKWRRVLLSLHEKSKIENPQYDSQERMVLHMFRNIDEPDRFLSAAQKRRLRYQRGARETFKTAVKVSSRYMPYLEKIFIEEGVPPLLARIPYVESSFNVNARSKVGASGIWQFIPSTARLFLKINASVDERNDPILAARAAAKLLKKNYESLGEWGLAVTAYNHGRKGMKRAIRILGTREPSEVLKGYRSVSFGFASRNFLSEILAAIELDQEADEYFPGVRREPPMNFTSLKLRKSVYVSQILKVAQASSREVRELNPALSRSILRSKRAIPKGISFRLPSRFSLLLPKLEEQFGYPTKKNTKS